MTPAFIGIATAGRPAVLASLLVQLASQSHWPRRVLICPAGPGDVDGEAASASPLAVDILPASRGLCSQRNAILSALAGEEDAILIFFDDDFVPAPDFVENALSLFDRHPDIVMATGRVLADGVLGPGLAFASATAILERHRAVPGPGALVEEVHNGYGCNMAVRLRPVLRHGLRFDEDLPLYGWLEDVDFSRRLAAHGRIVRSASLEGVHLGDKRGRSPGKRLGYSQVANPAYLVRKGTLARGRAFRQIGRNLMANLAGIARPEPWVDRRGRALGNALALWDLMTGRIDPRRIVEFQ